MRQLILFRHAKAEARAADGEDIDRALAERGRADAARVGRSMADAGLAPDLALVSSAVRARETWDCAAPAFPKTRVEVRDGLYNATAEEVAAELVAPPTKTKPAKTKAGKSKAARTKAAKTVIVVGHNPSLQELAVSLLIEGGGPQRDIETLSAGFPTATAAAFRIDAAGRAVLDGLFHARDKSQDDG